MRHIFNNNKFQKGEVATTLTLISLGMMILGTVVGTKLVQIGARVDSKANFVSDSSITTTSSEDIKNRGDVCGRDNIGTCIPLNECPTDDTGSQLIISGDCGNSSANLNGLWCCQLPNSTTNNLCPEVKCINEPIKSMIMDTPYNTLESAIDETKTVRVKDSNYYASSDTSCSTQLSDQQIVNTCRKSTSTLSCASTTCHDLFAELTNTSVIRIDTTSAGTKLYYMDTCTNDNYFDVGQSGLDAVKSYCLTKEPVTNTQNPPPPNPAKPPNPGAFHLTSDIYTERANEGIKFDMHVLFNSDGCDGDIMLYRNGAHVAGPNGWNIKMGPFDYNGQWAGNFTVKKGERLDLSYDGRVDRCPRSATTLTDNVSCSIGVDGNGNPWVTGSGCNWKNAGQFTQGVPSSSASNNTGNNTGNSFSNSGTSGGGNNWTTSGTTCLMNVDASNKNNIRIQTSSTENLNNVRLKINGPGGAYVYKDPLFTAGNPNRWDFGVNANNGIGALANGDYTATFGKNCSGDNNCETCITKNFSISGTNASNTLAVTINIQNGNGKTNPNKAMLLGVDFCPSSGGAAASTPCNKSSVDYPVPINGAIPTTYTLNNVPKDANFKYIRAFLLNEGDTPPGVRGNTTQLNGNETTVNLNLDISGINSQLTGTAGSSNGTYTVNVKFSDNNYKINYDKGAALGLIWCENNSAPDTNKCPGEDDERTWIANGSNLPDVYPVRNTKSPNPSKYKYIAAYFQIQDPNYTSIYSTAISPGNTDLVIDINNDPKNVKQFLTKTTSSSMTVYQVPRPLDSETKTLYEKFDTLIKQRDAGNLNTQGLKDYNETLSKLRDKLKVPAGLRVMLCMPPDCNVVNPGQD